MKLGFIGLGIMGIPMAINPAHAGHQLHVMTVGSVADELLSPDAVNVEVARQVTEASDIILITVSGIPQIKEVLFGKNGYTKASLKGETTADMSSISSIETKHFARQMNKLDDDYLDAPVSGGEIGTREGTLSVMVGGDEAVSERVKPLFELFGKNITLVNGDDNGQTCKAANQVIVALNIETVSEALLLVSGAGADPVHVHQALMGDFVSSCILKIRGECMIKRTFNPGFETALRQKNLNLVL